MHLAVDAALALLDLSAFLKPFKDGLLKLFRYAVALRRLVSHLDPQQSERHHTLLPTNILRPTSPEKRGSCERVNEKKEGATWFLIVIRYVDSFI